MPLKPGARLGVYEVTAKIGEGGMGEVYRAHDTKLNRDVALKVLPDLFASDPDRLARFEREAQVLASLNHPNIGAIYGLEESEGVQALALELIEGQTLADRMAQGPIPLGEALPIATQIAEALEAAHEQGIIHRDLKPANVKVKDDGTVKVLDFGLAKAVEGETGSDPSQSPTLTAAATQAGVIMGTAAYMSPEQAAGRVADRRSDIWSFGIVLFEMLTGRRLFTGETVSHVLAKVLERPLDFAELPASTPAPVSRLLRRCLERDPKRRLRDVSEALIHLEEATTVPSVDLAALSEHPAVPQLQVWQRPIPATIVVVAVAAITGIAVWTVTRPTVVPEGLVRFSVVPSETAPLNFFGNHPDLAISPGGTHVVYKGPNALGTLPQLNLRPIDQLEGAPLRGAEGGLNPFVSPDGEWVGFVYFQGATTLQKVSIFGGPPVTVTESPTPIFGANWGADDRIIFGTTGGGLFRVSGGGGEPEALTTLNTERGESSHLWPFIIDEREAVVFVVTAGTPLTNGQLAVLDLATGEVTHLGLAGVSPHYVSTGHLVYAVEDGSVRAVPFDTASLTVMGSPVPLLEGVSVKTSGAANFSLSSDGRLVYALDVGGAGAEHSLVWVDREGREEPIGAEPREYRALRLSPDGERAAVVVRDADGAEDVHIYDLARDIPTRFTFDAEDDSYPVWSPDGQRVVFSSQRDGEWNLFGKAADGTGEPERLATSQTRQMASDWSPDGRFLIFTESLPETGFDIAARAMDGDAGSEANMLVQTEFGEFYSDISPDGRWLAYQSNESGRNEVYVRPFPNVEDGRWQVSRGGGNWPAWAPDGRELFYRRPGPITIMAAPIDTEATFQPGNPEALFDAQDFLSGTGPRKFDVAPDGRFLMIKVGGTGADADDAEPPQINVVLNWFRELTERVPVP